MRKKLLRSRSGFEKPESREEAIMQNILGASNVLEPSESNIEEILKSILYDTPYTKEAEFEIEKSCLLSRITAHTTVKPSSIYIEYK